MGLVAGMGATRDQVKEWDAVSFDSVEEWEKYPFEDDMEVVEYDNDKEDEP